MSLVDAFSSVAMPVADAVFTNPLVRMSGHAVEIAAQQPLATLASLAAFYAYYKFNVFKARASMASMFMPSMHEEREVMARTLLARGHASVDEILESSYGHWPPKGLDIVAKNPQQVRLVGMFGVTDSSQTFSERWKDYKELKKRAGGVVYPTLERRIGLSNNEWSIRPGFFAKSGVASVLGHEGVHVLQIDHTLRAAEIYTADYIQAQPGSFASPVSNYLASDIANHTDKTFVSEQLLERISASNLHHGVEIQARLHQIIAEGYQTWGRMPVNKEELQVALIGMGLKAPKPVLQRLEESPTRDSVQAAFPKVEGLHMGKIPAEHINQVAYTLSDIGRDMLWEFMMPALYSDLIEMYGDGPGRERFGFGQNERLPSRLEKQAAGPDDAVPEGGVTGGVVSANNRVYGNIHGSEIINSIILERIRLERMLGFKRSKTEKRDAAPEPAV